MKKSYKKLKNELTITIVDNGDFTIPQNKLGTYTGKYEQTTVQHFPIKQVKVLKQYVKEERAKGEKEIADLKKQLEPIKDLIEIPEAIINKCTKAIGKGAKEFKKQMNPLTNAINNITRRTQILERIKFLETKLVEIVSDDKELSKI